MAQAPFFFVAVGSMANIGGAVTAPIVASAFDPALAPVGVLLAVLGYALGTCTPLHCLQRRIAAVALAKKRALAHLTQNWHELFPTKRFLVSLHV